MALNPAPNALNASEVLKDLTFVDDWAELARARHPQSGIQASAVMLMGQEMRSLPPRSEANPHPYASLRPVNDALRSVEQALEGQDPAVLGELMSSIDSPRIARLLLETLEGKSLSGGTASARAQAIAAWIDSAATSGKPDAPELIAVLGSAGMPWVAQAPDAVADRSAERSSINGWDMRPSALQIAPIALAARALAHLNGSPIQAAQLFEAISLRAFPRGGHEWGSLPTKYLADDIGLREMLFPVGREAEPWRQAAVAKLPRAALESIADSAVEAGHGAALRAVYSIPKTEDRWQIDAAQTSLHALAALSKNDPATAQGAIDGAIASGRAHIWHFARVIGAALQGGHEELARGMLTRSDWAQERDSEPYSRVALGLWGSEALIAQICAQDSPAQLGALCAGLAKAGRMELLGTHAPNADPMAMVKVDMDARSPLSENALSVAASGGDNVAIDLLLPHFKATAGRALAMAAASGQALSVAALLPLCDGSETIAIMEGAAKFSTAKTFWKGDTPVNALQLAALAGHADCCELLAGSGKFSASQIDHALLTAAGSCRLRQGGSRIQSIPLAEPFESAISGVQALWPLASREATKAAAALLKPVGLATDEARAELAATLAPEPSAPRVAEQLKARREAKAPHAEPLARPEPPKAP